MFFFFNDTATTEIYTLSLHDALPIFERGANGGLEPHEEETLVLRRNELLVESRRGEHARREGHQRDRKSTRLNSSHSQISYAVFCLKKKNNKIADALAVCSIS